MSSKAKTLIVIVIFIAVLVGAGVLYSALSDRTQTPSNLKTTQDSQNGDSAQGDTKEKAPACTFYDGDGKTIQLSEIISQGKPVVVNFWASWCPPCKEEMPYFQSVYSELGKDVTFVMIDAADGSRETVDTGKAFVSDNNYTFPVYFDSDASAQSAFGITGYPETFFIDKDGIIQAHAEGGLSEASLREGVNLILK